MNEGRLEKFDLLIEVASTQNFLLGLLLLQ